MSQVAQAPNKEQYLADLEKLGSLECPDWVKTVRESGASRFKELEFPNQKQEAWRFTNISPIVNTTFSSVVGPGSHGLSPDQVKPLLYGLPGWVELVFVNGFFAPDLSRLDGQGAGVKVGSIADGLKSDPESLRSYLQKSEEESSAFTALNTAFLQDGAYVHISADQNIEHPIHIVHVNTGASEDTACYPRNLIVAGHHSESVILESYVGVADARRYFTNGVTEIVLEDGAHLHHYKVVEEGERADHLMSTRVQQDDNSFFESFVLTLSGSIVRNELCVTLDGSNGECSLNGLYLDDKDRLIDNAIQIDHAKSHCRSRIAYKGVIDDESKAVFTGKVNVCRGAQRTDSDQLNNTLLLSDKATIDTKPQLEIYADDVKCTHGATVGQHPEEVVFYFRSRGMSEAMARGMLTYGFAGEIVAAVEVEPLRSRLEKIVFERYSP